jgi:hypothetical protein
MRAYDIGGVVVDSRRQPLHGATVALLSLPDSVLVDAKVTGEGGSFTFGSVEDGTDFLLSASMVGYARETVAASRGVNEIRLTPSSSQLEGVTVVARHSVLEPISRGYTYKPYGMDLKMSDAMRVLEITPLLEVNPLTNGVTITGVGEALIYLNGKLPVMSQEAVRAKLRTIPPSRIKRIDIITNPGFEAGTTFKGGIVNIEITAEDDGVVGYTSQRLFIQSWRVSPFTQQWIGIKRGKFSASASVSYSGDNEYEKQENIYEYYLENKKRTNTLRKSGYGNDLTMSVTGQYAVTDKSELGVGVSFGMTESHHHTDTRTETETAGDVTETHSGIYQVTPVRVPFYGVGAEYRHTTDEIGSDLCVRASAYKTDRYDKRYLDFSGVASYEDNHFESSGYGLKFSRNRKFASQRRIRTNLHLYTTSSRSELETSEGVNDNVFDYDETAAGLDATYSDFSVPNLTLSGGLSLEYTWNKGVQRTGDTSFHKKFLTLTPNVSLGYKFSGNFSLSLDYTHRTYKPSFDSVNPFRIWYSDNTCYQGNTELKQHYNDDITLSANFLRHNIFGVWYAYESPVFERGNFAEGDVMVMTLFQFGHQNEYGVFYNYNSEIIPSRWRVSLRSSAKYVEQKGTAYGYDIGQNSLSAKVRLTNDIILWPSENLSAQLYGLYSAPSKSGSMWLHDNYNVSLELSKYFRCGVSLSVSVDLLRKPWGDGTEYYKDSVYSYSLNKKYDTRHCFISFSYVFGNRKTSAPSDISNSDFDRSGR